MNKLTLILLAMLTAGQLQARQVVLSLDSPTVSPGGEVAVSVTLTNPMGLGRVTFALGYEASDLIFEGAEPGDLLSSMLFAVAPEALPDASGTIRFEGILADGLAGEGEVLLLRFSVPDSSRGVFAVGFDDAAVSDPVGGALALATEDGVVVATNADEQALPEKFALHANYPNPFNPRTTIGFDLPVAQPVTLTVYDILGRRVAILIDGHRSAGRQSVVWDSGQMASGLYLYVLSTNGFAATGKMMLVK